MDKDIFMLVASYLAAVRKAVADLQTHLGTTDLLKASKANRSLRTGTLYDDTTYAFHGVGCRIKYGNMTVDFEFGPNGVVGGFDAWRLWLFVEGAPSSFPHWKNRESIDVALRHLLAEGAIALPRSEPSPHLYYLTEKGEKAIAAQIASSNN